MSSGDAAAPWLSPDLGELLPPLRQAAPEGFAAAGQALALRHGLPHRREPGPAFFPRLRANVALLQRAQATLGVWADQGQSVGVVGDWLLDHIGSLAAQVRAVQLGLPRRFYRSLPVLAGTPLAGTPRVVGLAWAYVEACDSVFRPETLDEFLAGYQTRDALTLGELWALPTSLRVVLIENLRRLVERAVTEAAARSAATALLDPRQAQPHALTPLIQAVSARGVARPFWLQVAQDLHGEGIALPALAVAERETLRAALDAHLPDPEAAQAEQHAQDSADAQGVAHAISALQALDRCDWQQLVQARSATLQTLADSPVFMAESLPTQDRNLHAIEALARRSRRPEPEVASQLMHMLRRAHDVATPEAAPGHWLHGPGRRELHTALGLGTAWLQAGARLQGAKLPLYLLALALGSAALVMALSLPNARASAWGWLSLALALLPASEAMAGLLQRLLAEWLPARPTPRLAWEAGIPAAHRVLVVVPAMLHDARSAASLAERLAQHHLANRETHSQFALLTDFEDAPAATQATDAALLQSAIDAIDALELRYPPPHGAPRRFLLLHRPRQWCQTEGAWIGWERKRGKLAQLLGWLVEGGASPVEALGRRSQPVPHTPWVLTLDADTRLPPGTLRALVGVGAHPLNLPRWSALTRRVIQGHGIWQPRVDASWPSTAQATPFHRLFAGLVGHDPYHGTSSEVYADLFDEASFSGKGLLHAAAVHAVLTQRLPPEQVLSHDLVEGIVARCGSVSDVVLAEPAPGHPVAASSRLHRWTRGDWQLLPLLLHPARYGLNALGVWKLLDNLRRSLVAPASLALLGLSALGWGALAPGPALALALLGLAGGPLLAAVAGLAPQRDDLALRHFLREAGSDLLRALAAALWQLALWPHQAGLQLQAMALALWRSAVSRRHLLQWVPAARVEAALAHAPARWRPPLALPLLALLAWVLVATWGVVPLLPLSLLCALWAASPWVQAWAGRPRPPPPDPLSETQRLALRTLAQATWGYFDTQVGPLSHHLPPDNVQSAPHTVVAARTSPTNIGMYLVSLGCARALGWLSTADCLARATATLDTLDRLPSHRGHVLNWIDTQTLQPLGPAYVSAVDSGNLCVCLLALAGALDAEGSPAAMALAERCRAQAQAPDFGFLYDPQRRLLRIGWQVDTDRPDAGHYDLLASEARLASLWAIAKGDVPVAHWAALGRPVQAAHGEVGLRSWSGSMFEYLMPPLLLHEPAHSLLGRSARMAVAEQRRWARAEGLPWGVSECAHATVDANLAYQYGPQGVPRLGLRRAPPDERVIAPYACAMALPLVPAAALANLHRLQAHGASGPWGLLEALDYTASRQAGRRHGIPVATTMAHHQGMALLAMTHVLLDGRPARWTLAEPQLAAVACLLHERVPREVMPVPPALPQPHGTAPAAVNDQEHHWQPGHDALPPTALLGRGPYSVTLRPNGAGWSRFDGADLNRWRDDALRDEHGHFLFLQREGQPLASFTQHPAPDARAQYSACFQAEQVQFSAQWPDLRARCTVWVSPNEPLELRRLALWNTSSQPITLAVCSAFEVSLSEASADEAHPAFANLFISADWDAAHQSLQLQRRPRRDEEPALHALHFVAHADLGWHPAQAVADRARWRGRLRSAAQPLADFGLDDALSGPRPTGLDPVAALRLRITLPPHGHAELLLATAAERNPALLHALRERFQAQGRDAWPQAEGHSAKPVLAKPPLSGAALASATRSPWPGPEPLRLGELAIAPQDRDALQQITTALVLLLARPAPSLAGDDAADAPCPRSSLWRLGVGGDRPLITVHIGNARGLRSLRVLLQGLARWAQGGVPCDLVVVNIEPHAYLMPLQHELIALRDRHLGLVPPRSVAQLHLCTANELSPTERRTLALLARVRLKLDGRSLPQLLAPFLAWHAQAQDQRLAQGRQRPSTPLPGLAPPVGTPAPGAFEAGGQRYRFDHSAAHPTPRPWVNVQANPDFGALVTEAGGGCTWAGNSRLQALTAWSNDPLDDLPGEAFWLQDTATGEAWPLGRASAHAPCRVTHSAGLTRLQQSVGGIAVDVHCFVDATLAVKRVQVRLHNPGPQARALRVIALMEWVMGPALGARRSVHTDFRAVRQGPLHFDVLLATQRDHASEAPSAFMALNSPGQYRMADWTCDRREFYDPAGHRVLPIQLGQHAGSGGDPCAAVASECTLPGGGRSQFTVLVGHAPHPSAALALAAQALAEPDAHALARVRRQWRTLQGGVQVRTPDPGFDALVNHWLLLQTVACRLWARASFYQAGGAYGYRDQLQDAMALDHAAPALLRAQLLRAASRQFEEGDVQHWWHPPEGAGVRTHFSDDRLWLPHALLHAWRSGHHDDLLDATAPFLHGQPLPLAQEDAYTTPAVSAQVDTLYEHAARAIDRSLATGAHGLPLIGGGDWNDGMNRIGPLGQGESVWLGWFLAPLLQAWGAIALSRGDTTRAKAWTAAHAQLQVALDGPAWDGAWYRRAYFDDGSPLGSAEQAECRIDLIAQAWAVLSNAAPDARQAQALHAVSTELARPDAGLLPLLTPPLQHHRPAAGYIQAYPPGVRENGGQYNHGAVWALMAQAQRGDAEAAWRTFTWVSPAHRSAHPRWGLAYGLEPYAVAADVYTEPPYVGRGGWSWTTGSAAWLHRAATGSLLGLQREGSRLRFVPCLPPHWPSAQVLVRHAGRRFRFTLQRSDAPASGPQLPAGTWLDLDTATAPSWTVLLQPPSSTVRPTTGAEASPADQHEPA